MTMPPLRPSRRRQNHSSHRPRQQQLLHEEGRVTTLFPCRNLAVVIGAILLSLLFWQLILFSDPPLPRRLIEYPIDKEVPVDHHHHVRRANIDEHSRTSSATEKGAASNPHAAISRSVNSITLSRDEHHHGHHHFNFTNGRKPWPKNNFSVYVGKPAWMRRVSEWIDTTTRSTHEEEEEEDTQSRALASSLSTASSPGAVVHIDRTGESAIAHLLRNSTNGSYARDSRTRESFVSPLSTYYHPAVDSERLAQSQHNFYLFTVRDPLERTILAFINMHPRNVEAQKGQIMTSMAGEVGSFWSCFPTLETFAMSLGDADDYELNNDDSNKATANPRHHKENNSDCGALSRAVLQHKIDSVDQLHHDMRKTLEFVPGGGLGSRATFLAIRTEFLWEDWVSANQWLGQSTDEIMETFSASSFSQLRQDDIHLPVTKELSREGQNRLCRALAPEYNVYLQLVQRSVNLSPEDVQNSIERTKQNCAGLMNL